MTILGVPTITCKKISATNFGADLYAAQFTGGGIRYTYDPTTTPDQQAQACTIPFSIATVLNPGNNVFLSFY